MLSHAHGACADPLLGETIGHNLERTIARVPDSDALIDCGHGVRYTYGEFGEAVERLAGGMLAAGLHKGDRVGVWSPNRSEWALTQYATAKAGVILVNINPAYRLNELAVRARCSRAAAGSSPPNSLKDSDFVEMVDHVRPRAARARARDLLRHARVGGARRPAPGYTGDLAPTARSSTSTTRSTSSTRAAPPGFPKGATLTHHNILNNGYFVGDMLNYTERDRVCIPVPLYHCFGMVLGQPRPPPRTAPA